MKKIFAVLALMLATCLQGHAQLASLGSEKGSTNWETLTSSNYKVVYPVGMDSLGRVYSGYLEQFRPLVGNSAGFFPNQQYRKPMPVVLHPFAATANGAVVWGPRRMDIYTYPDAYSSLPPVPWEKILAIHENRHVAQMQFGRAGFWKYLYWPFGELIPLFVGSIYSNHAFLEGDARKGLVGSNPEADGEDIHGYPEYPLLHVRRRHKELSDYIAHKRNHVQKHGNAKEALGGGAVEAEQYNIKHSRSRHSYSQPRPAHAAGEPPCLHLSGGLL